MKRRVMVLCIVLLGSTALCDARGQVLKKTEEPWAKEAAAAIQVEKKHDDLGEIRAIVAHGTFETSSDMPEGFGKVFHWNREESKILLVICIDPRDHLGVGVTNLKKGDLVEVTVVSGTCSFEGDDSEPSSSIVGAIMAAATVAIGDEKRDRAMMEYLDKYVRAAEEYGDTFCRPATGGKPRDVYGRNPEDRSWGQDEGGVLVCLPSAEGVYYAGDGIKDQGPRHDNLRPAHVEHGFFLVPSNERVFCKGRCGEWEHHNKRKVKQDGELHVLAWDSNFEDNGGCYRVFIVITREP